jgi:hypothetical protein
VVAGALGVSGRAIVNRLIGHGGLEVIGLSRRCPDFPTPGRLLVVLVPTIAASFSPRTIHLRCYGKPFPRGDYVNTLGRLRKSHSNFGPAPV